MSHPTWVRGLKLKGRLPLRRKALSHPTWVRGLKYRLPLLPLNSSGSHSTWVRGLKSRCGVPLAHEGGRTPRGCVD